LSSNLRSPLRLRCMAKALELLMATGRSARGTSSQKTMPSSGPERVHRHSGLNVHGCRRLLSSSEDKAVVAETAADRQIHLISNNDRAIMATGSRLMHLCRTVRFPTNCRCNTRTVKYGRLPPTPNPPRHHPVYVEILHQKHGKLINEPLPRFPLKRIIAPAHTSLCHR
jgi:hypothetical protein